MADILLTAEVQLGSIQTDDIVRQIQGAIDRSSRGSGGRVLVKPTVDTTGIERASSAFSELRRTQKEINSNQLKLMKLDANDTKQIELYTKRLQDLQKAYSSILSSNISNLSGKQMSQLIDGWKDADKKVSELEAKLTDSFNKSVNSQEAKAQLNEVKQAYTELSAIQKEISSKEIQVAKLDPIKNVEEIRVLNQEIASLRENYDKLFYSNATDGFSTAQFSSLTNGFEQAAEKVKEIQARLSDSARASTESEQWKSALQEVKQVYSDLLSIQKEIGSKQVQMANLDPTKNAQEIALLRNEIEQLQASYNKLFYSDTTNDFSTSQFSNLTKVFEETESKIEHIKATLRDTASSFGESLKFGKEGFDFEKLTRQFDVLTNVSPRLKESMAQLKEAYSVLTSDNSDIDQKVEAYRRYISVLEGVKAAVKDEADAESTKRTQLKEINQLLDDVSKTQEKYRNLSHGDTKGSYDSLSTFNEQLIELKGNIDNLTPEQVKVKLDELRTSISGVKTELGDVSRNSMGGLSQLESRFVYMFGLANVVMQAVRQIKQMISTTIELDSAMTQLRVVTNASENDYANYSKAVSSTAKEIGASITDLIDSTTVFARLGYTLNESSALAKYTAMLSNVGDIDVSSAQNALTAITKAYDINATEIETVMDKMVKVGNNFPISVAEIAEGMNNAGSALHAAGNSFEQSVALLTAANTTIQNVSKSSTGLRTITARIRKTKTELDDLGETVESAAYEEVVNNLTKHNVLLTTANGEYRSTYDILKDISGVWGQLTSMEQAAIAEQLAGKLLPERIEMCA